MIHTIYTMTLRQYGEMDETSNLNLLKRWYNPFPLKWFNTEPFFEQFSDAFGSHVNLDKEVFNIIANNRIMMLDRMYKTMLRQMEFINMQTTISLLFNTDARKIKSGFNTYVKKVKDITGITIKDATDLAKLQKDIQRRVDKYRERNPEKPKAEKVSTFMKLTQQYFLQSPPYQPNMTIAEFAKFKKEIDERNKSKD